MPTVSLPVWSKFINDCPQAHILQTPAWGELKSKFGWESCWVIRGEIGAQVLFQKIPFGFQIAYIPRGPFTAEGVVLIIRIGMGSRKILISSAANEKLSSSRSSRTAGRRRPSNLVLPRQVISPVLTASNLPELF